jgi:hypothetical protein
MREPPTENGHCGWEEGITSFGYRQAMQGDAPGGALPFAWAVPTPSPLAKLARFRPLGIPLEVETNEPELLIAVAEACRGWEDDVDPAARSLHLNLVLDEHPGDTGEPDIHVEGQYLRIEGGGIKASADAESGYAWCRVSARHLLDHEALRRELIDPVILFLVTRRGRAPIHAAGFLAGDLAILLAGAAGAGKSCLALAAHQAGFRLLSDDTVYISMVPDLRIWGIPGPIHLFPEDAPTSGGGPVRIRNGKLKRAVSVRPSWSPRVARRAVLCVLDFGTSAALHNIDQVEALRRCGPLEAGFDLLRAPIDAALERLTRDGAWRLTLSPQPAEAIALLADNLAALGREEPA